VVSRAYNNARPDWKPQRQIRLRRTYREENDDGANTEDDGLGCVWTRNAQNAISVIVTMTATRPNTRREVRQEAGCNVHSYLAVKSEGNSSSSTKRSSTGSVPSANNAGVTFSAANGSAEDTCIFGCYDLSIRQGSVSGGSRLPGIGHLVMVFPGRRFFRQGKPLSVGSGNAPGRH